MQEGLLWRDGRVGDLAEKVLEAAAAHKEKYGKRANCCHLHPSMLAEAGGMTTAGKIALVADAQVLPNELWIGLAEEEECPGRACPGSA